MIEGKCNFLNILTIIPELKDAVNTVSSSTERKELKSKLKNINLNSLLSEQQSLLSSKSFFVSGAIPCILWTLVLVIIFNFIIFPILGAFGIIVSVVNLPEWYSSLCGTIVLGLLAKKAWDSSDLTAGSFSKKPKKENNNCPTESN